MNRTHSVFVAFSLSLTAFLGCTEVDREDLPEEPESEPQYFTTTPSVETNKIVFGHLDDAAGTNLLQYDQNRLFVTRTDYAGTPVMHHFFRANISSLVVGDFALAGAREHGHDQVCAILSDGTMECYAPSDDRTELWWWFTQPSPLAAGEQAIVGDFTGDGADDILAFSSSAGTVRLLSRTQTGYFTQVSAFASGNLASLDLHGKKLYAGEFGQAAGRADLVVVDPVAHNVRRYDTATDASGRTTFWWAFTTASDTLLANEQVTVANLDGGSHDALLLRDPATGQIRLMRAEYSSGSLDPIPSSLVSLGQLPITTHTGDLVAVKISSHPNDPGYSRDDTMFFDRSNGTIVETSARWDGARFTYWWGYTKATPVQTGWPQRQDTPMAVILCKLPDVGRTPDTNAIRHQLLERGSGGVRDYLFEVSYGTMDIANADVFGWVTGTLTAAQSSARIGNGGWKTGDYIADCEKAAGVNGQAYNGHVLVVLNDSNVSFQGINNVGATVEYDAVLGGEISAISHEVLHSFGLNHANDDSGKTCGGGDYCDIADVMGNFPVTQIVRADGSTTGPELNAAHRGMFGGLPNSRVLDLDAGTAPASQTITLAPLEQPEAAGMLSVSTGVGLAYWTIEYRRTVGLDQNTGVNGVQIHFVDPINAPGKTTLQGSPNTTLGAGSWSSAGLFAVHVDSIDASTKRATITVTH